MNEGKTTEKTFREILNNQSETQLEPNGQNYSFLPQIETGAKSTLKLLDKGGAGYGIMDLGA